MGLEQQLGGDEHPVLDLGLAHRRAGRDVEGAVGHLVLEPHLVVGVVLLALLGEATACIDGGAAGCRGGDERRRGAAGDRRRGTRRLRPAAAFAAVGGGQRGVGRVKYVCGTQTAPCERR